MGEGTIHQSRGFSSLFHTFAHEVGEGWGEGCIVSRSHPRKRNHAFKLRDRLLAQLAARAADFGKLVYPRERPHGVEDRPAISVIFVFITIAFLIGETL